MAFGEVPFILCPLFFIQASLHGGPDIHPDERDMNPTPEYNNKISKFIKEHFKSLATQSSIYEVCIITASIHSYHYTQVSMN